MGWALTRLAELQLMSRRARGFREVRNPSSGLRLARGLGAILQFQFREYSDLRGRVKRVRSMRAPRRRFN